MPKTLNPSQISQKWLNRMQSSDTAQAYSQGIDQTTVNPMQLAADQEQKYLRKITEAVNSGKRKARLLATDPSYWKQRAKSLGAQRIASGALESKSKTDKFWAQFAPYLQAGMEQVRQMPNNSDADSKARMNFMFDYNKNFKRS